MPAIRPGPGPWTSIALRGFLSPLDQHTALEPGGRVAQRGLLGGFQLSASWGIWACSGTSIRISAVTARSYDSQRLSCSLGPPHMYCDPSGTLHTPLPPTERRCTGDLCAFETKSQNRWGDLSSLKRARYLSRTRPMDQNCTGEVPESTGSTHIAETGR